MTGHHQAEVQLRHRSLDPRGLGSVREEPPNAIRVPADAISMEIGAIWTTRTGKPMSWPSLMEVGCSVGLPTCGWDQDLVYHGSCRRKWPA